jgi:hypothetical protein
MVTGTLYYGEKTSKSSQGGALMEVYAGLDLHATNTYVAMIDGDNNVLYKQRHKNDVPAILSALDPFKKDIQGVVVESTFNWYWLVDALMDAGYRVHLANVSAIKQYEGLKQIDDKRSSLWLANLLRLNILPTGYIYPKEVRPIRDLLRKRAHLGRLRTSLLLSAQNIVLRNQAVKVASEDIKKLTTDLTDQDHRDLGDETTPTPQTLLESLNDSRGGRDFGHDDPFGNRLYRSLSQSGQLRVLLSFGHQPTDQ